MHRNTFIKGLTLAFFLFLVTGFVLYRSGQFNTDSNADSPTLQTSPNGGAMATTSKEDSIKRRQDSLRRIRLSSSKSMIMTDDVDILPSSKSGPVFTPRSEKDTVKKPIQKTRPKPGPKQTK